MGVAVVVVRVDAAEPGEVVLACRATDAAGATDAPPWNVGGYANPEPHRVPVTVLD